MPCFHDAFPLLLPGLVPVPVHWMNFEVRFHGADVLGEGNERRAVAYYM